MNKDFHIGESCQGGTLSVSTGFMAVKVEVKHYKTQNVIKSVAFSDTMALMMFLTDVTTAFYADKVKDFVKKSGVELRETSLW